MFDWYAGSGGTTLKQVSIYKLPRSSTLIIYKAGKGVKRSTSASVRARRWPRLRNDSLNLLQSDGFRASLRETGAVEMLSNCAF